MRKPLFERGALCFYMQNLAIEKLPEFDNHKLVSFISDSKSGLRGFIAVHRGNNSRPSFGATRLWRYATEIAALRDALGLARTMSYKLAMAGLPYGGAKAVLLAPYNGVHKHVAFLKSYAERVNYLAGRFITGTDVGLNQRDLYIMRRASPYMVGMKGDVTRFTAFGILQGIKVSLKEVFGSDNLARRTFAIQGVGKVGGGLLKFLYPHAKRILIADIDREQVRAIVRAFPKVEVIKPSEIHRQEVDVFTPCAVSHSITRSKAHELACKIVAGGANSQLEDGKAGDILYKRGILYAPDYVINAGGLICVVDEYEHKHFDSKRVMRRVLGIRKNLRAILALAKRYRRPTYIIADEMAEKRFSGD